MRRILLFSFFLIPIFTSGQALLKGKVINEKSREPLAFVNIVIKNTYTGTTSDIDGLFQLAIPSHEITLVFSYLGFESRTITVSDFSASITVTLKEKPTQLQEVVVRSGDNPAFRIIRQAVKNKSINDPENLPSFSYNSYNKLYSTLLNPDSSIVSDKVDTVKFNKYLRENHLFIHESYTEKKFLKPNFTKETVLGNHLSGVKDPFFAFVATDLQPFSFYKDFIQLFDKHYINPLSKGSTERYDFILMDTIYHESDSIYVIGFEPLPGKVFDALKGQLYISTDGYAIEHVIAQPADDKSLVESLIQQKYEKIDGHWFPVQLNSELRFKQFNIQNLKLKYVSHSYITNVKIGEEISAKEFSTINVQFAPDANRRDSTFWKINRTGAFDKKEKNTFHVLDSLGEKLKTVQAAFKVFEALFVGRFRAGPFYIPIEHILQLNRYEGARLGFGFQTGEKISKWFSVEAYAGYGFHDRALKYGGSFQLNISNKREVYLKFSYKQDLAEPGRPSYLRGAIATRTQESLRNWMTTRMDSVEQFKVELNFIPFHFSQASLFLQQQKRNPTYDYAYLTNHDVLPKTNFIVTEAGLQWRYVFKEAFMKIGERKIVTGAGYPQLNVFFSKSFSGLMDGQYDFVKVETRIDHQFLTRGLGKTTLQFTSGFLSGNAPYPYLFNARGSKYSDAYFNNILVLNTFQTMGLYEFFSDQYASLFLNHNLGRITGNKMKYFRPELFLVHNMGIGSMRNKLAHQNVVFSTMEKGYVESGLIISNIIRINYLNLVYFGLGGGGFYRYGNYALPATKDNIVTKFIITLSF
jgi:hypothetical protein